jgi:hypothetical protein
LVENLLAEDFNFKDYVDDMATIYTDVSSVYDNCQIRERDVDETTSIYYWF